MAKGVFKVGDIVKGIKGNGYGATNDQMPKAEVLKVYNSPLGTPRMDIKVLEHERTPYIGSILGVANDNSRFTLVKPETIVIYRKGNEVIAHNKATGKKGVAKCKPEDTFDFTVGAKLAFDRLYPSTKIVKCDKYEVGDKVKILDTLRCGDIGYGLCVNNDMEKSHGKIVTINTIESNGNYTLKDNPYYWTNKMFEGKVVPIDYEEPMFKKGDVVEVVKKYDAAFVGLRGEIVRPNSVTNTYLVDFKVRYPFTHYGNSDLLKQTGYWVDPNHLKKVY